MINLRTVAALAPVGAGFWLITHPGLASSLIAAGTVGAAVVQHTLEKQKAERAERKATEAAAKQQLEHEQEIAEFMVQNAPQALPKPTRVINYEQAGQAVTKRV